MPSLGGGSDRKDREHFKKKEGAASIARKSDGLVSPETVLEENHETNMRKRLLKRHIAWDGNGYDPESAWIEAKAKAIVDLEEQR